MQLEKELINFPLFSSLNSGDLNALKPHLSLKKYPQGQIIFTEGQIGSHVYFVLDGQIKLSKLAGQREHIIDWCGPYQTFAEILLLDPGPFPVTAEAVQESTVIRLENSYMPQIFMENPKLALALIRTLNKRLRLAQEFIRILTSRSKAGILASTLLRLATPINHPNNFIIGVDTSLTHKELANMIGTSREVVSRTINHWKRLGIIRVTNDRLEILDPNQLADWP